MPAELHAIVFVDSDDMIASAGLEALRRRERGERFYGMAVLDDLRVRTCNDVAGAVNRSFAGAEERQAAVRALGRGVLDVNGEPVMNRWDPSKFGVILIKTWYVLTMCDELLVRSYFEYNRYTALRPFNSRGFRRILLADTVPTFERRSAAASSVVVWAGRRDAHEAALALLGLERFDGSVAYVAGEPLPNVRARFIARDNAAVADALGTAGCIVCIDSADPSDAVAFVRRGIPVVAPLTCGAYEFVEGVVSWDAGDGSALPAAVGAALAKP